jgi:hypothetical protein
MFEVAGLKNRIAVIGVGPGHGRISGMGIIEASMVIAAGHTCRADVCEYRPVATRKLWGDENPGTWDP